MPIDVLVPAEWRFKTIPVEDQPVTRQFEIPNPLPHEDWPTRQARELLTSIRKLQQFMELAYVNDYEQPHTMAELVDAQLANAEQQAMQLFRHNISLCGGAR